jgi:hypothetical protein
MYEESERRRGGIAQWQEARDGGLETARARARVWTRPQ